VFAVAEIAEAARQTRTAHTPRPQNKKKKKKGFAQRKTKERERESSRRRDAMSGFLFVFQTKRNKVTWRVYNNHVVYESTNKREGRRKKGKLQLRNRTAFIFLCR
jgi:hypothetical protein